MEINRLIDANHLYAAARANVADARPSRRLAVVALALVGVIFVTGMVREVVGLKAVPSHSARIGFVRTDGVRAVSLSAEPP